MKAMSGGLITLRRRGYASCSAYEKRIADLGRAEDGRASAVPDCEKNPLAMDAAMEALSLKNAANFPENSAAAAVTVCLVPRH